MVLDLLWAPASCMTAFPTTSINKVQGTAWGFKSVWELDAHPTDQTMFYTEASYNTAFDTAHIDTRPAIPPTTILR